MIVRPRHLKIGDTIGVIAPGGPPDTEKLTAGTMFLKNLGFELVLGRTLTKRHGYLAGPDEERAEELHEMFENGNIQAIFCARGGTGSLRLLPHLDFSRLSSHPKIFMGYSDITCLQIALYTKMKWVTFYGPMVAVDLLSKSFTSQPEISPWMQELIGVTSPSRRVMGTPILKGQARGRLLGGCLSMIRALCGSEFMPPDEDIILFWEDINEDPYKLDMMLAQLRNCGFLGQIKGMLIGELVNCGPKDDEPSLTLSEIVDDYCKPLDIPVVTDLPFGHGPGPYVMPQGVLVEIDGQEGYYHILDATVD